VRLSERPNLDDGSTIQGEAGSTSGEYHCAEAIQSFRMSRLV